MIHARRAALAGLLAAAVLAVGTATAVAHALLVAASPAANAVLSTAPSAVTLTFSEPPDPQLSSVRVLDASGAGHTAGPAVAGADAKTLNVPLGPLADGVYTVAWRTVSAADGHATAGSYAFSVGTGAPAPGGSPGTSPGASPVPGGSGAAPLDSAGASAVSLASVLARALLYLGLVLLLGALAMGEALLAGGGAALARIRVAAWAVALTGAVWLFAAQAADAGVAPGDALASSLGLDAAGRALPVALAGAAMLAGARATIARRAAAVVAIALTALALLADAAASHAATAVAPVLNIALQWFHGLGVSVWIGGLAGLLLELRRRTAAERARLLAGFSRWATIGIVVVGLTGIARAAFQLDSLGQLVTTDYGRLLLAKLALFAALAGLGAVNHFRNVPGGGDRSSAAQRAGSVEVLLGATAIVVATLLVTTPPPSDAAGHTGGDVPAPSASPAAPTPAPSLSAKPLIVEGADDATAIKLTLTITPGTPGPSKFSVVVHDFDTGAPVPATGLKLRFALPSRPDVGASSLALTKGADSSFTGSGSNLALTGIWSVTAVVTTVRGTTEIPLAVPIAQPTGPVDISRVAGQPTLFSVRLAGGRSAQLYIEPSTTGGPDTLHITYFDSAGKELAVGDITAEAAWPGVNPSPLLMSPIEPGHATAKLRPPVGTPILVLVSGTGPDGAPIVFSTTLPPDR